MTFIKFRENKAIFYAQVTILKENELIQLTGELPEQTGDFDVMNDAGEILQSFENFDVIYDSGENYLQLTNDKKIYYNYLIASNKTGYIVDSVRISDLINEDNYYLYQYGQGKPYKEFKIKLFDVDNFPIYKLENKKLIKTSQEEKDIFLQEKRKNKLEYDKAEKIANSKIALNNYLENNPILSSCHNGVLTKYSVSLDKQTLLTNNYLTYTIAKNAGVDAKLTWNAMGQECDEWAEEEYLQLILEIRDYVKPLVSKQQSYEVQIKACTTQEELDAIFIDYD